MKTVWLLIEQMDYESAIVHSVYENRPHVSILSKLIIDSFAYAYTDDAALMKAEELYTFNETRMLGLYTWSLEERAVM